MSLNGDHRVFISFNNDCMIFKNGKVITSSTFLLNNYGLRSSSLVFPDFYFSMQRLCKLKSLGIHFTLLWIAKKEIYSWSSRMRFMTWLTIARDWQLLSYGIQVTQWRLEAWICIFVCVGYRYGNGDYKQIYLRQECLQI